MLLDIGLPDMDGWHLLEALRQEPRLQSEAPAILVMTAYGDPANRLIGKLQGVDGYLIKPCSIHEVRHAVAESLHLLDTAELTDPLATVSPQSAISPDSIHAGAAGVWLADAAGSAPHGNSARHEPLIASRE